MADTSPADGLGGGVTPPSRSARRRAGRGSQSGPRRRRGCRRDHSSRWGPGSHSWRSAARRRGTTSQSTAVVAAAGSAAAISAIFGNPLIAAVLMLEVLGLARRQAVLVVLPCLVSSGVGALVFSGLGSWTGLGIGELSLPGLGDGQAPWRGRRLGSPPRGRRGGADLAGLRGRYRSTALLAKERVLAVTVVAGLLVGASAAVYSLVTDRSPDEVALSGQATPAAFTADPGAWSTAALLTLVLCKGTRLRAVHRRVPGRSGRSRRSSSAPSWARWPPTYCRVSPSCPRSRSAWRRGSRRRDFPPPARVLIVLLLGDAASSQMPVVLLAVVTALVVEEKLTSLAPARPTADHVG